MRLVATFLILAMTASGAAAQTGTTGQDAAARFQNMQAGDAARMNQAAQSDPRAREALDQVTKRLNDANHPSGRLLDQTRPRP